MIYVITKQIKDFKKFDFYVSINWNINYNLAKKNLKYIWNYL